MNFAKENMLRKINLRHAQYFLWNRLSNVNNKKDCLEKLDSIRRIIMTNKKYSLVLVALFITILFFYLPDTAQCQQGKVIELAYSNFYPSPPYGISVTTEAWAREIEKRSKGRVKITIYHNGVLTSAANCYDGVVKGLSDIGQSVFSYTPGRFPVMEVIDLPGYHQYNGLINTHVANDVYKKFKPRELDDVHVLFVHSMPPGGFCFVKKEVKVLEDFKGLRIRATGTSAEIVKVLGGSPVAMPKGDEYDALRKGAVDGTTCGFCGLDGYRVAEVTDHCTWNPEVGYSTVKFVVMNKKKWNSLPPDIQQIFTEVSEEWIDVTGKMWAAMDASGYQFSKKFGLKHFFPKSDEAARWRKAVCGPLYDRYIKVLEAKGLPGKEVLEYRQQAIEKYSKMYLPPEFFKEAVKEAEAIKIK